MKRNYNLLAAICVLLLIALPMGGHDTTVDNWKSPDGLVSVTLEDDGSHAVYWNEEHVWQKFAFPMDYYKRSFESNKEIMFVIEFIEVRFTLEDEGPPKNSGVREFNTIRLYPNNIHSTPSVIHGEAGWISIWGGEGGWLIQRTYAMTIDEDEKKREGTVKPPPKRMDL